MKEILVDSGLILVCDPNLLIKYGFDWNKFTNDLEKQKANAAINEIEICEPYGTGILFRVTPGEYNQNHLRDLLAACECCSGNGFLEVTNFDGFEYIEACRTCKQLATDKDALEAATICGYELDTNGKVIEWPSQTTEL